MIIHTMTLGELQTNCYLVWADGSKSCAVIDPGYHAWHILDTARRLGVTIDSILLTHGHFDHVGAVEELVEATGCKLWMHEADWSKPNTPMNNYLYPIANCDFCQVDFFKDDQKITAGGLDFTVRETPGHTAGSVCFFCGDACFSGDTLFAGGCGRTDLGGDWNAIVRSLHMLRDLPGNHVVYPGHGGRTSLDAERKNNPYLL